MDLEALVRPVIESAGLEFVEVSLRKEGGGRVLRVTVDREGGADLDAIAEASERISRRLDLDDVIRDPYRLEVSSPGIERPLRAPRDFRRRVGDRVKVKTTRPIDGARRHAGALAAADDEGIVVATGAGERRLSYEEIASARTVFDWDEDRGKR